MEPRKRASHIKDEIIEKFMKEKLSSPEDRLFTPGEVCEQNQLADNPSQASNNTGNKEAVKKILTADKLLDEQEERLSQYRGKEIIGLAQKSLPTLDEKLLGLRKYIVLAAAPNVGKTALTIQLGIDIIKHNNDTCLVYVSLEMSRDDIMDRMRCHLAHMTYRKLYFGSQKDLGGRGWYTGEESNNLANSKKILEKIGNRILILDEENCPQIDADEILRNVDNLKGETQCNRVVVIIDYLQVFLIPEKVEHTLYSDNSADKYRHNQMKKLHQALGNDPLIVISEARKPSGKEQWGTSLADIMGSSRTPYGITVGLFLVPVSNEQLEEITASKVDGNIIRNILAEKGMSFVNLSIEKGRDGMEKGTILMMYHFRENRFEEINKKNIDYHCNSIVSEYTNMAKKKEDAESKEAQKKDSKAYEKYAQRAI